jgi:hypothetical protein
MTQQEKPATRIAELAGKLNEVLMDSEANYSFTEVFNALGQIVTLVTLDYLSFTERLSTEENFAEQFNKFIRLVGSQAKYAIEQERIAASIAEFAKSGLILPEQGVVAPPQGIILTP